MKEWAPLTGHFLNLRKFWGKITSQIANFVIFRGNQYKLLDLPIYNCFVFLILHCFWKMPHFSKYLQFVAKFLFHTLWGEIFSQKCCLLEFFSSFSESAKKKHYHSQLICSEDLQTCVVRGVYIVSKLPKGRLVFYQDSMTRKL